MYERTNIFTVEIITAKSQNKSFISINLGVDEIRLRVMVYDVQDPRIVKRDAVNVTNVRNGPYSSDSRFINDTIAALLMSQ